MSINPASLLNAATNTATSADKARGKTADKDMFMTLLVAQLKNQDPLQPQDGAAFVAQLAQFNSLDQLIGIRQSVDKLNTLLQQV
jgi:flagellar basal-body rod modification protein FlgD